MKVRPLKPMKLNLKKPSKEGFTIVELMITTVVFSVVLLVASAGIIAIGRAYYKSLTSNRVHETARSVMEDVSRSLQFSTADSVNSYLTESDGSEATIKTRCFGPDRYTYVLNQQVSGSNQALYRDKRPSQSSCSPGDFTGGSEMLGQNMRLLRFDVSNADPFNIKIKVAYGDNDLLTTYDNGGNLLPSVDPAAALCKSGIAGSSFCAVSELETTLTGRVE